MNSSMFTPDYQQQSGQKNFETPFNPYLKPLKVQATPSFMFGSNIFQRTFASVVSSTAANTPITTKTTDDMNPNRKGFLNNTNNNDGILNRFFKKIVSQKKSLIPSKVPFLESSQIQKEFEDFNKFPSYLGNHKTASNLNSHGMQNFKNRHVKQRQSIEHDIRVDCDIFNIKNVCNNQTNQKKIQTEIMKLTAEHLPTSHSDNLPFEIYSQEEFPAIEIPSHQQHNIQKVDLSSQKIDETDECDFVKFQDDIAKITPTFIPRRYNLCEKVSNMVKSPKKLLPMIPMMSPRRSCLKPTPRRRTFSECSDDFIVFDRNGCEENTSRDHVDNDNEIELDDDDDSDASDDEDDGIVNADSDDEELEEDETNNENSLDDINSPHQPDSGMEEKKVHFNLVPKVHVMIAWNHAYRQARRGDEWRQEAVDRERFAKRISECARIIDPILNINHRGIVFHGRFDKIK